MQDEAGRLHQRPDAEDGHGDVHRAEDRHREVLMRLRQPAAQILADEPEREDQRHREQREAGVRRAECAAGKEVGGGAQQHGGVEEVGAAAGDGGQQVGQAEDEHQAGRQGGVRRGEAVGRHQEDEGDQQAEQLERLGGEGQQPPAADIGTARPGPLLAQPFQLVTRRSGVVRHVDLRSVMLFLSTAPTARCTACPDAVRRDGRALAKALPSAGIRRRLPLEAFSMPSGLPLGDRCRLLFSKMARQLSRHREAEPPAEEGRRRDGMRHTLTQAVADRAHSRSDSPGKFRKKRERPHDAARGRVGAVQHPRGRAGACVGMLQPPGWCRICSLRSVQF